MPPSSSRMTKNRQQPTRYRPGKAEVDEVESEDESDASDDEDANEAAPKAAAPKAASFPSQKKLAVDLSRAGQQVSTAPAPKKPPEDELEGFVTASESSEEEGRNSTSDDDDDDDESSEEEASSDDEAKKPLLRPTFISKARRTQQSASTAPKSTEAVLAEEEATRKAKADELLQAQLERDAASRAAGRKAWDDDTANIDPEDEVDDTDDLDPEAERASWKLRELKRVRRDRLSIEEKEKEREEIERRRNMTAEEREAEDREYIAAQHEEREGKGKMGFMQKYYHKGAFFGAGEGDDEQDEEVRAVLSRDLAGAQVADEAGDKSGLPEYMRIRDMTQLGRKGRTKYKDLRGEDTGRWGVDGGRRGGGGGGEGLDERFRPDGGRQGEREQTGANAQPVGERRRREDEGERDRGEKRPRHG
ncbi:hypothetical protein B0A55_07268 [Friedmanniomyces simplex]|uniref:Micro-fibrillar-associated protein 1 C-terminal domain-containing protein n=1 Tax=Friedmanniomyces simplex TaxID=329884 RepID=A0A4U0WYW5_9PEZI|nr:hypothetical protein B0A55_07268 [Friedmanniomyces simplex]